MGKRTANGKRSKDEELAKTATWTGVIGRARYARWAKHKGTGSVSRIITSEGQRRLQEHLGLSDKTFGEHLRWLQRNRGWKPVGRSGTLKLPWVPDGRWAQVPLIDLDTLKPPSWGSTTPSWVSTTPVVGFHDEPDAYVQVSGGEVSPSGLPTIWPAPEGTSGLGATDTQSGTGPAEPDAVDGPGPGPSFAAGPDLLEAIRQERVIWNDDVVAARLAEHWKFPPPPRHDRWTAKAVQEVAGDAR